jgi:t-SNARE complex subunit (syntaxin)
MKLSHPFYPTIPPPRPNVRHLPPVEDYEHALQEDRRQAREDRRVVWQERLIIVVTLLMLVAAVLWLVLR